MTPLQAIKAFCYQCAGENRNYVTECGAPDCPLYPYRKGHTASGRKLTEDQKAAAVERLKKAREKKVQE